MTPMNEIEELKYALMPQKSQTQHRDYLRKEA
jgi:hypothetical protein